MLQINKNAKITLYKYNLLFLFRNKNFCKFTNIKKTKTSNITLRAPKHFNIGKHKVFNLNYKTRNFLIKSNNKAATKCFVLSPNHIFYALQKRIQTTPTLFVNSLSITIQTKFKLKWLEILFFF
jgi:hypothetical protein